MDDIKSKLGKQKEDCSSLQIICIYIYLEAQSRRTKLGIEGVIESPGEKWMDRVVCTDELSK